MGFLSDLTQRLRHDLARDPLDEGALMARAAARPPARDFAAALTTRAGTPAVIAEVKRASPSAGAIAEGADAMSMAAVYEGAGATAISVLTEPYHFHGSLTDLDAVRAMVAIPVLRKDFLVHPAQVIEARAHGADAILLIAACCSDAELASLRSVASDLGMGVLLETHSDDDLDRALATDAPVIGVNARDLETLEVDVDAALGRIARIGAGRIAVMESGIAGRADVMAAASAGTDAVLVGEALMRSPDPGVLLHELTMREESIP